MDRHVHHGRAGRDRRRVAGRRARVAVLRVRPGHRHRRRRAGSHPGHGPVRGHGPVPEGGRGATHTDRPLFRQPERDQPERVQEENPPDAQPVRRRTGAHHHIGEQRQGDGGAHAVRRVRPVRHALHGHVRAVRVRASRRQAQRGRPVRVRGRAVRQHLRLHAHAQVLHRTFLPDGARRCRVLQEPGRRHHHLQ